MNIAWTNSSKCVLIKGARIPELTYWTRGRVFLKKADFKSYKTNMLKK